MIEQIEQLINEVCLHMGVSRHTLFSSHSEICVDARSLLFTILWEIGFSDEEISRSCGLTRQCINKLRNGFNYRLGRWTVRQAYKHLSAEYGRVR